MSNPRLPAKVGLFVFVCLVLLGFLIINFSKGSSLFRPTYTLLLRTEDVGGIKQQAAVLLGGLRVGWVTEITLAPDGRTVLLRLKIYQKYAIRQDARFAIEQAGFLGDQHVAVYPQSTNAAPLADGAEVRCEEPFNIQEAARSATGFIQRIDQTAIRLSDAIERVDRMVLSSTTLSNVHLTLANFRSFSERILTVADRVDQILATNTPSVSGTLSNWVQFSESLDELGKSLNAALAENRADLKGAMQHLQSATKSLDEIARDVRNGQGIAGSLLRDSQQQEAWRETVINFQILSSNLSRYGLLYKPRPPKKESSTTPVVGGARGAIR